MEEEIDLAKSSIITAIGYGAFKRKFNKVSH